MVDRVSLSFGIESKPDIESIIGSSDSIFKNELHVRRGSDYAKKLIGGGSKVSVALIAKADRRSGSPSYTVGYIENAQLVFNYEQVKPLMVNHEMVQRAVKEFMDNDFYPTYEIVVISPPMQLSEFFQDRATLTPYATPDVA